MRVTNVYDTFTAPCAVFFPHEEPKADGLTDEQFKEKIDAYNKEKEAFLTAMELKSLNDNLVLKFSLGGIIFDLVNSAILQKVFIMPESPKLLKRLEKQFIDYAQIADNEEIEIPDSWLVQIDKLFADDALFSHVSLHGEITGENKKTLPLKAKILSVLPKLNETLLRILPA